jgi:hypothetical protein
MQQLGGESEARRWIVGRFPVQSGNIEPYEDTIISPSRDLRPNRHGDG